MTKKYRRLSKLFFLSFPFLLLSFPRKRESMNGSRLNSNAIKRGFTLTEVVIAAIIMSLTIGGLFSVFISSNRFVQRANRRLSAVNLAQNQIERRREFVRADTWTNANNNTNLGTTGAGWNPGGWIAGLAAPIPQSYRYRVVDDSSAGNPVPAAGGVGVLPARRVFMQVQWTEPN